MLTNLFTYAIIKNNYKIQSFYNISPKFISKFIEILKFYCYNEAILLLIMTY